MFDYCVGFINVHESRLRIFLEVRDCTEPPQRKVEEKSIETVALRPPMGPTEAAWVPSC